MNILIGENSRLTQALCKELQHTKIVSATDAVTYNKFGNIKKIIITAAITDPRQSIDMINQININLPVAICENNPMAEIITFGTTLEKHKNIANPYVESKRILCSEMLQRTEKWKHFRLNTLYGIGEPKKHMFLADLLLSIKSKSNFQMGSGHQLREYHHYNDVAAIIKSEFSKEKTGIYEISNGNPVTLFDLARGVIERLESPVKIIKNLKTRDEVSKANTEFYRCDLFREPITGVAEYFRGLLK